MPEKVEERNDDGSCKSSSSDESADSLEVENDGDDSHSSDLLYRAKDGTKYKKRKVPRIIRYIKYNKKKDTENYFREQLMLFTPWRNEQKDLLGSFDTFEAHYNSLKTSLESKSNEFEYHTEELELARQMMKLRKVHMIKLHQMRNKKTGKQKRKEQKKQKILYISIQIES